MAANPSPAAHASLHPGTTRRFTYAVFIDEGEVLEEGVALVVGGPLPLRMTHMRRIAPFRPFIYKVVTVD